MSAVPATGCGLGKALDTFELMFTDVVFNWGARGRWRPCRKCVSGKMPRIAASGVV